MASDRFENWDEVVMYLRGKKKQSGVKASVMARYCGLELNDWIRLELSIPPATTFHRKKKFWRYIGDEWGIRKKDVNHSGTQYFIKL